MDTPQPPKKSVGYLTKVLATVSAIAVAVIVLIFAVTFVDPSTSGPASAVDGVHVHAYSWNNGKVNLWHELIDGPDVQFSQIPDGAYCTKLDENLYKLGSGETAIYYYKLLCGGKVGYVAHDQVTR